MSTLDIEQAFFDRIKSEDDTEVDSTFDSIALSLGRFPGKFA